MAWYIKHFVSARAARATFGIETVVKYDSSSPVHLERKHKVAAPCVPDPHHTDVPFFWSSQQPVSVRKENEISEVIAGFDDDERGPVLNLENSNTSKGLDSEALAF